MPPPVSDSTSIIQPEAIAKLKGTLINSQTKKPFRGIVSVIDLDKGVEVAPKYLREDGSFDFSLINKRNYLLIIQGDDFFRIEEIFYMEGDKELNLETDPIESKMAFTSNELRGYQLFLANCNTCHKEPLFSDFEFRSNGLSLDAALRDSGRAHITGLANDRYKFKTPSLRNVEITWPYMHDGRYKTLEACLDHYTKPFSNLVNLDANLPSAGFELNAQDKLDLLSFLKTLTDTAFTKNKRFMDPKYN